MKRIQPMSKVLLTLVVGLASTLSSGTLFAQESPPAEDSSSNSPSSSSPDAPSEATPKPLLSPLSTPSSASPKGDVTKGHALKSDSESESIEVVEAAPSMKEEVEKEALRTPIDVTPQSAPQGSTAAQKIDYWDVNGLTPSFEITSHGNIFNNLDFRKLAPPTAPFIDILDSDDRTLFAVTQLAAGLTYKPIDAVETAISVKDVGHWGKTSAHQFSVERLFVRWNIWNDETYAFKLTAGRQKFSIGNFSLSSQYLQGKQPRDYLMSGVVDGVTFSADFGLGGSLHLLPVDVLAIGARPEEVHTATPVRSKKSSTAAMRFDGDYNTFRSGVVYENSKILKGLDARAFFFYANVGSNGTGSDRSYRGATGNVSDKDYNWMAGLRLNYILPVNDTFALGLQAEYARSGGIDRKAVQAGYYDVSASGNAYGATLIPSLKLAGVEIAAPVQFFMADGDRYTKEEGLPYSYGFVSFKGQSVGGLLLSNALGWRPSAYVTDGVSHSTHDKNRNSGSMVLSAGIETTFLDDTLGVDLNFWYLADRGHTNFPVKDKAKVTQAASQPVFGYTRADIEAQERLGKSLATEIDLGVTYSPYKILSIYATGGVVIPGAFYKIEIDRQVGTYLGSTQAVPAWGCTLGMTLSL